MRLLIYSLLPTVFLATAAPALAQGTPDPLRLADSLRKEIDSAWLTGDRPRLESARRMLDRATVLFPKDGVLLHYKGYAIYRALQAQPEPSPETRTALLTEGLATFSAAAKLSPLPESYILRWALLGQTISDAGSAMAVLNDMQQELADALRLGKENPRVWLVQAVGTLFTPAQWGGGPEAALEQLTRGETLFKSDRPAKGLPDWGHAELHAWLGLVHQKLGHKDESRRAYQEALRLEPGFAWVKDVLLPGLEKGVQPFPPER